MTQQQQFLWFKIDGKEFSILYDLRVTCILIINVLKNLIVQGVLKLEVLRILELMFKDLKFSNFSGAEQNFGYFFFNVYYKYKKLNRLSAEFYELLNTQTTEEKILNWRCLGA